MQENRNKKVLIALIVVIILILIVICISLLSGKINSKSNNVSKNNTPTSENRTEKNNNSTEENENEQEIIKDDSAKKIIGYYQLLNSDFAISKYDSSQNSKIDLEVQLLKDGTAKIAYQLNDNDNIIKKQYNLSYTIESKSATQINNDHYRVLKLQYPSKEVAQDNVFSKISANITYNPASQEKYTKDSYPKSLVIKGELGSMSLYMIESDEVKYLDKE